LISLLALYANVNYGLIPTHQQYLLLTKSLLTLFPCLQMVILFFIFEINY
jgi:hypothetical protein